MLTSPCSSSPAAPTQSQHLPFEMLEPLDLEEQILDLVGPVGPTHIEQDRIIRELGLEDLILRPVVREIADDVEDLIPNSSLVVVAEVVVVAALEGDLKRGTGGRLQLVDRRGACAVQVLVPHGAGTTVAGARARTSPIER